MATKPHHGCLLAAIWSSWIIFYSTQVMAPKPQPRIPGTGPARSRGCDSVVRHVLSERHLASGQKHPPRTTTKAPPAPQATEPEVLSTFEERRPLLSPELPPAGSTLSISRSRWPEKPSPRSVCWSHPRLAKRWPAGQIWPTDVFSLASTMLDHFLEPTFNNLEISCIFLLKL